MCDVKETIEENRAEVIRKSIVELESCIEGYLTAKILNGRLSEEDKKAVVQKFDTFEQWEKSLKEEIQEELNSLVLSKIDSLVKKERS